MHAILDCENIDTALKSLAVAFAASPADVATAIDSVDLDAECELADYEGDPNWALMRALTNRLGRKSLLKFDEVRWNGFRLLSLGS